MIQLIARFMAIHSAISKAKMAFKIMISIKFLFHPSEAEMSQEA